MPIRNTVSSMLPPSHYIVQWQETPVPIDHPLFKIGSKTFDKLEDAKSFIKSLVNRMRDNIYLCKFVPKQNPDGMMSFDILTMWRDVYAVVTPLEEVSDG